MIDSLCRKRKLADLFIPCEYSVGLAEALIGLGNINVSQYVF